MRAYYNEFDKNAAAWLRELIKEGLITDGEVDERSIEDVLPADLVGFDRCHFFAGIGVWDYSLNLAGFEGSVWTGSCPCQPFSAAGKGEGFTDERHLWPAFFHLISQCRPDTLFGEQVASTDGLTWLDLVHSDLEGIGYTIGAADIPVAGVGAPHRRQRLFFVADAGRGSIRSGRFAVAGETRGNKSEGYQRERIRHDAGNGVELGIMAHSDIREPRGRCGEESGEGQEVRIRTSADAEQGGEPGVALGDTDQSGPQGWNGKELCERAGELTTRQTSFTSGFWRDAEWIYCRDEKYRPTKPGIFPLVNGATGRVALLRGAGNAISPQVAQAFIESYLEVRA